MDPNKPKMYESLFSPDDNSEFDSGLIYTKTCWLLMLSGEQHEERALREQLPL